MTRTAFDIETVSPDVGPEEYPSFDDPTDFQLQSCGVAIEEDGEVVSRSHVTRDGWGAKAELEVIDELVDLLVGAHPDTTFTYNGERFDCWLLRERARIRGQETGDMSTFERVQAIEERVNHEDLKHDVWNRWGNYTTLEEAMMNAGLFDSQEEWQASQTLLSDFEHGFDYQSWSWKDSHADDVHVLESTDVAFLGEHYLDGIDEDRDDEGFIQLEEMLDHYVRNDVDHLFRLADARPF